MESMLYTLSKKQIAPVLCDYVYWVLKEAEKHGITTLYFLARDGYTLRKIAGEICEKKNFSIECKYLYCSRASLRMPSYHILEKKEIYNLLFLGGYHVSLQSFFERAEIPREKWSCILKESGIPCNVDLERELTHWEICDYRNHFERSNLFFHLLIQNSKNAYPNTIAYFRQEGLLTQETVGIVDSGWAGSMQRSLRQLLQSAGFKGKIVGFYFGMYEEPKEPEDGEYSCWYFSRKRSKLNKILFCNNLFECFLFAPHPMTISYQKCGMRVEPVFACSTKEYATKEQIKEQILGIMSGAEKCMNHLDSSCKRSEAVLRHIMAFPNQNISQVYGNFLFCDDITERYQIPLVDKSQEKALKQYILPKRVFRKIFKWGKREPFVELYWPYGTIAQIQNRWKKWWYWINFFLWQCLKYTFR